MCGVGGNVDGIVVVGECVDDGVGVADDGVDGVVVVVADSDVGVSGDGGGIADAGVYHNASVVAVIGGVY